MVESAADLYARVVAQVGEGGRLPTPSVAGWDIFPWQAEDGAVVVKPLAPPAPEEPRHGEAGVDCRACGPQVEGVIWRDDVWRVRHLSERSGLPLVLFLEPYEHVDFGALDEGQAAQFGMLSVRLARIVESLPNIARCHVMRVGDGAEHLHIWFMGRTEGLLQARGSCAVDWDDILPPGPEDVWRADLAEIARKLATHGGVALVCLPDPA